MARIPDKIIISDEDKIILEKRVKGYTFPKRDSIRANIILLKGEGISKEFIEKELSISRRSIGKWINRFQNLGINGLNDAKGRGRKTSILPEKINTVLTKVTQPPAHKNRWSRRSMAKEVGISATSVGRIWKANDIKPHLLKTFKLSKDSKFEEKFWDIIGLYLSPPEKALVFCCDEKSQCQALERTQPGLPLGIGHIKTKTHDYYRHGTTTLFAALNYLDGTIISKTQERHRHEEWLRFLKQIDKETSKDLEVHLILDNYSTHKHEKVKEWFSKKPRFKLHFTPTGSSWLNLVERFFADITNDIIREGSFNSVKELEKSIKEYLEDRNKNPYRYVWKAEGVKILHKINKARKALGWNEYCEGN